MAPPSVIRALHPLLIDQIAAGEVVERPCSVVKELIENALDGGATNIAIDLGAGGLDHIVVTDDGVGIAESELHAAVTRYATSKIRHIDDLLALTTYGFRGEALSSIAAVSRLILTSRPQGASVGQRLTVTGGSIVGLAAVGCPPGTSIAVQDLFFNVPARRKFLRAAQTEQAHITDSVLKTALGRRAGGFVLTAHGRCLLDLPASAPRAERPGLALGRRMGRLSPFAGPSGEVQVEGFLAAPSPSKRPMSQVVWCFVNGRPVKDRTLHRAAVAGYQAAFVDQMPQAILYVDLPGTLVDVNVHPQKSEVRFQDATAVYRAVAGAVAVAAGELRAASPPQAAARGSAREALSHQKSAARAAPPSARQSEAGVLASGTLTPGLDPRGQSSATPAASRSAASGHIGRAAWALAAPTRPLNQDEHDLAMEERWTPLGLAPAGFVACQDHLGRLALVRLVDARLALARRSMAPLPPNESLPSTRLLLPPCWQASALEAAWLQREDSAKALSHFGAEIAPVVPGRYLLAAAPSLFDGADPLAAARGLLALIASDQPARIAWKPRPTAGAEGEQFLLAWLTEIGALAGWPEQRGEPLAVWGAELLRGLAALGPDTLAGCTVLIDGDHPILAAEPGRRGRGAVSAKTHLDVVPSAN